MISLAEPLMVALVGSIFVQTSTGRPQIPPPSSSETCDSIENGFTCRPDISHLWGQYSPFYTVQSEISPNVPSQCSITFAQVLARHGARFPKTKKSKKYGKTVSAIQKNVHSFPGNYSFLEKYNYALGAEQLTAFGVQEMVNSGEAFYERYADLANSVSEGPFVRASGGQRIIDSAYNFTLGFHNAKASAAGSDSSYPYGLVVISESKGSNNTLNHGSCPAFEASTTGKDARNSILGTFIKPITDRLNNDLDGANLNAKKTVYLMDMCPFDTVNSPTGAVSPFCSLFTQQEWTQYDYYQSVSKYYRFGAGNELGPTQGVGFVNELIARLTEKPVQDHTSVNQTLDDAGGTTFPLDRKLYADFTHDNGITSILFALGLFNDTRPLSTTQVESVDDTNGYTAARTVPFASRMYMEKMKCDGNLEELVRVIVNGRVIPLNQCTDVDDLGRCTVSEFVKMLSFAAEGGKWDGCFADAKTPPSNGTLQKGSTDNPDDDDDDSAVA